MPGSLFDTNVWLAAIFTSHPFHTLAQEVLQAATPADPAVFCRSTQQSFLRLASTPALLEAYGAEGLTNRDALVALRALLALPQVCEREEPPGVRTLWHRLASRDTASPRRGRWRRGAPCLPSQRHQRKSAWSCCRRWRQRESICPRPQVPG